MKKNRRKFNPEFKTKVVLEALSERLTLTELAQKYELHPNQITLWKREFLDRASEVFSKSDKTQKAEQDSKQETEELYKTIGQLKVEVDWLKKTSVVKTLSVRRSMIEKEHPKISLNRQCELLSIHRSGLYYQPRRSTKLNRELMRLVDEQYLLKPYYGVYRMWEWLVKDKGYKVNIKRVRRLCRLMGLEAIGPKPNTSKPAPGHKVYPYLLRGLTIQRCNQVWATDITYVPMAQGFMYLMAVIDLKSRYVLNWSVSNTMDATWCAEVFREAVSMHGAPEILNTDQGSQFTSEVFTTAVIKEAKVKLSMDGRGRAIDNVFIERLWRSVKYEYIYYRPPVDGIELYQGLKNWFNDYNTTRRHKSLNGEVPATVYYSQKVQAPEAA